MAVALRAHQQRSILFFAKVYSTVCTEQLSMHTPSEATLTASCAAVQKAGAIIDRTTRFSHHLDED